MIIGHSRIGYPGSMDITVKSGNYLGKYFAPPWSMVMGVKDGSMSIEEYKKRYFKILENVSDYIWSELLYKEKVIFACYCKDSVNCHRGYLCKYLIWKFQNIKFSYLGEQ